MVNIDLALRVLPLQSPLCQREMTKQKTCPMRPGVYGLYGYTSGFE